MPFNVKKALSKSFNLSSSSKDRRPKHGDKFTKLESPSMTTLGQDETASMTEKDIKEMKRKAWEAKRARDAEAYLARHGFGVPFPGARSMM